MNISELKPASSFANNVGVKAIIYGPAGSGKTPVFNTAPRPVLLACEPGLLSMKGSQVPTFKADHARHIDDFFAWFFNSKEANTFDTLGLDSASEMCEHYLRAAEKTNKHGLAAYGEMAENVLKQLDLLYQMPYKHAYIIAKQEILPVKGINYARPYYPGKQLPVQMPHKYDGIFQLDVHNVPGVGQVKAFRCQGSIDAMARDRTGNLSEYEQPDFGKLVTKAIGK